MRQVDWTRANSQRQLPTDHDYAVPIREYQSDPSSLITAQAAAHPGPRGNATTTTKTTPPNPQR